MPERPSWDDYFLQIATAVASRATCSRGKHGAVIVSERRVVATGYDGAPAGLPHCADGACAREHLDAASSPTSSRDCLAVHAPANALLASSPEQRDGASVFCTLAPCFDCAKLIANSGVAEVVASAGRHDGWPHTRDFLRSTGVRVRLLDGLEGVPRLDLTS